ncbi:GNAT family N-acetyltransferase [Haloarchaeobius sp. TZWWS8]|uniref:GNAT family N-acetyltransferase n=1 Tax=Haloarchaeobius sp. TZWWS8 TaxID=3446121 RepID=UPI003EB7C090
MTTSKLFPRTIETERLRFERAGPESVDALEVYPYYSSEDGIEDATRFMTWEPHSHPKETWEFIDHVGDAASAGESVAYAIYPKDGEQGAGEFAGTAGLHPNWDRRSTSFGIWLRKPFWGRGYSGERADAFVQVAFDRLGLEFVSVSVVDENTRSKRAIEKYVERWGGQHDGYFRNLQTHGDEPASVHRFTISRSQYESSEVDAAVSFHD